MRNAFKIVLVVVTLVLVIHPAALASESSPAGRWWQMPVVVKQLDLSGEQIDRLEDWR